MMKRERPSSLFAHPLFKVRHLLPADQRLFIDSRLQRQYKTIAKIFLDLVDAVHRHIKAAADTEIDLGIYHILHLIHGIIDDKLPVVDGLEEIESPITKEIRYLRHLDADKLLAMLDKESLTVLLRLQPAAQLL